MSHPRGLLLDLDGTVADSIDFFFGLSCEVLAAAGLPPPPRATVLAAIAEGVVPHDLLLPADWPDRADFLARMFRERWPTWLERYRTETQPLPGACPAVERLHERGLRIALVTSSSHALPFLDQWDLRRRFATIVGREDVTRLKPDPEPVLLALDRLGLGAAEALCVGDTPLDVRAARAAGVAAVGVLTGAGSAEALRAAGASAVLGSLAELPDFLDRGPLVGLSE